MSAKKIPGSTEKSELHCSVIVDEHLVGKLFSLDHNFFFLCARVMKKVAKNASFVSILTHKSLLVHSLWPVRRETTFVAEISDIGSSAQRDENRP